MLFGHRGDVLSLVLGEQKSGVGYMKFKFSQLFVFSTVDAFTLVDGERDDSLVVFNSGERSLLDTRHRGVPRHDYH